MQFDVNTLIILMLGIGVALAFTYYGTQLLSHNRLVYSGQIRLGKSFSGLNAALRVPRPVTRFYFPRIRAKAEPDGDEPPHLSF